MQPGVHFQALTALKSPRRRQAKVEVVEFFGYYCPALRPHRPASHQWLAQRFGRLLPPSAFQPAPATDVLQKMYFALELDGHVERLHSAIFNAFHREKVRFQTAEAAADWVARQGVDRAQFLSLLNSFTVQTKARAARQLADGYQINGVPSFGVAGLYVVNLNPSVSQDTILDVVDVLVQRQRKA